MISKKTVPLLVFFFIALSCVNKLDFNQIEDYNNVPEYTVSLTYFNITTDQFIASSRIEETSGFKIFDNSFIRNNVVKVDFDVETKNEFDQELEVFIEFLDDANNVTYSYSVVTDILDESKTTEEILISNHPNFLNSTQVSVSVEIDNSSLTGVSNSGHFEFKSALKVYIHKDA
jgi:hypothetical protein